MSEKGLHIIANFFECQNAELLINKEKLSELFLESVKKNNLTPLQNFFYKFPGDDEGGVTGYILLSESHVSIHTWPEKNNYIAMDIFVCNYSKNNTENARKIYEEIKKAFKPKKIEEKFIDRD